MKSIIHILFFFYCISAFSQKADKSNIKVDYKIYNNTALPNSLDATLYADNNSTIYLEKYSTQVFGESKMEGFVDAKTSNRKVTMDPYTRVDHSKKEVLFHGILQGNFFLVTDSYNPYEWQITEETKEIGGYSCIKATTSFRGRNWIAWFAPEISLPYGPWKLYGLPGLIMEAQDETGTYSMQAVKVEFTKDPIVEKDFISLHETKNKEPISYQQFLQDKQEYLDNTRARIEAKHNVQYEPNTKRNGKELSFEWE